MAFVREEENGQLFFDWEYLESITNKEFVEEIKSWISGISGTTVKGVQIENREYSVSVYLKIDKIYLIAYFEKGRNPYIKTMIMNDVDIEILRGLK